MSQTTYSKVFSKIKTYLALSLFLSKRGIEADVRVGEENLDPAGGFTKRMRSEKTCHDSVNQFELAEGVTSRLGPLESCVVACFLVMFLFGILLLLRPHTRANSGSLMDRRTPTLLLQRFPSLTGPAQRHTAMRMVGPSSGPRLLSIWQRGIQRNLVHYVRSGDFVRVARTEPGCQVRLVSGRSPTTPQTSRATQQ